LSAAIQAHHRSLADTLDRYVADVESSADDATLPTLVDQLSTFLADDLLPHARGEEQSLYPALNPIIREHGDPTATMRVDHEFIAAYVREISETAGKLRIATGAERAALSRQLDRTLIQLQGLFRVHLAKEERVYLPLVERDISPEQQEALLAALHEEAEHGSQPTTPEAPKVDVDVRDLPPTKRHPLIFDQFNATPVGGSFTLINDHDPKPLYYQLKAEYTGQLLWEYLEQGPEVWRVQVGKVR
jgi:uncharacterized protein (DUF2249 family)